MSTAPARLRGGAPWLGRRDLRAGLAVAGLAALALVATNAQHDLFHAGAHLQPSGALALLAFDAGPAYVAFQLVMALSLASALIALAATALRRTAPGAVRWQALLTGSGLLVPWLAFALFRVGPLRVDLDLTPFAFAVTSLLTFVALTRLGLADVSPIARSLVFDRMHDPVIVLDAAGAAIDANRAASVLLTALDRDAWRATTSRRCSGSSRGVGATPPATSSTRRLAPLSASASPDGSSTCAAAACAAGAAPTSATPSSCATSPSSSRCMRP